MPSGDSKPGKIIEKHGEGAAAVRNTGKEILNAATVRNTGEIEAKMWLVRNTGEMGPKLWTRRRESANPPVRRNGGRESERAVGHFAHQHIPDGTPTKLSQFSLQIQDKYGNDPQHN
jgi:hypothetical protein